MISWILTVSYLSKDTWKRWLEQPGSVLARSVVTIIMVALSILMLVGYRLQIEKLRAQVEEFGLDNLLVVETLTPEDLEVGIPSERFRSLNRWGELFTVKRMLASARSGAAGSASVMAYDDSDIPGLLPYLRFGREVFVLSRKMPQGLVVDYDVDGEEFRAVALTPEDSVSQVVQGDTLFAPESRLREFANRGFSMVYYLERDQHAPTIADLTEAIDRQVKIDGRGRVDVRSAELLRRKLESLEERQEKIRFWLALIMGSALALIYGVLSILEFRQSMYVSALLRSFGVSELLLGWRTVIENALIVNVITFGVISIIYLRHEEIFRAFQVEGIDKAVLYWGSETGWILLAANLGIIISCLPVFWALRKPVGTVLE